MNHEDMGRAYAYLVRYRTVETRSSAARRTRPNERDITQILAGADPDELRQFQAFLGAQGLSLVEHDDTTMPGIPAGGRVWLLVRSAHETPPPFLTTDRLYPAMKLKAAETNQSAAVWFLHVWLNCLAILYTRLGRGISEISRYQDAVFSRQTLEDAVRNHVEQIRRVGAEGGAAAHVVQILAAEKGQEIARRVSRFLDLMCDSALLQEVGEYEYQQTLLGAIEVAQSFKHTLAHLIPTDDVLVNIVDIADPEARSIMPSQPASEE